MTDNGGPGGLKGGLRRGLPTRPARVGDPNVLTGAATPNQLSSQVGRQGPVASSQPLAPTPVVVAGPRATTRQATPFDAAANAPRPRRRMSFSTLIFLLFAGFTVIRFLGQVANDPGAEPLPTTRPIVLSTPPGPITFGITQNDNCEIVDPQTSFATGTDVRWVAQLSDFQAPDAAVVVLYLRSGSRINREDVPPDPSAGKWDTLCSGDPVIESTAGHYILEIWNEDLTMLLSRGGYDVAAGP